MEKLITLMGAHWILANIGLLINVRAMLGTVGVACVTLFLL